MPMQFDNRDCRTAGGLRIADAKHRHPLEDGGRGPPIAPSPTRGEGREPYFFAAAAAARSTNVLPPFILWASGDSFIWITTASASTPRFLTSAWVMSRIMPAFCSSVRPAAMLTVISGIFFPLLLLRFVRLKLSPHPCITASPLSLEERPTGRVSKAGLIVLMVRDGARVPPPHDS